MSSDTRNGATYHDHVAATWQLVRGAHGMRAMWCENCHLMHASM